MARSRNKSNLAAARARMYHDLVFECAERVFRILLQEGPAWGLDPRGEDARATWNAGLSAVRGVLAEGIASGELLPADPDLLAPTVNAILQVQLAQLLDRSDEPDADAISDAILRSLRRLLCGVDADAPGRAA